MDTLTTYINAYLNGRRARGEITQQTKLDLTWTLMAFSESFGKRPLTQLGERAIDRWLEGIGHRAPATRREYLSRVSGFLTWMAHHGHIAANPTSHVPTIDQPRHVPVTFTPLESAALFRYVNGDLRSTAILEVLFGGGARCVEVSRLRVDHYDPSGGWLLLIGKAKHERQVPVTPQMRLALDAYLDTVGRTAGPFFRSYLNPSKGLAAKTISGYFRGWAYGAGVKMCSLDGRSAHGARRTAGSDVADETGDIRYAQALLGHARIETTAKLYLRPVPLDRLRTAMEAREYGEHQGLKAA